MINITPTFLFELSNTAKGIPEGNDTGLYVPYLAEPGSNPKNIKFLYKNLLFLPNPVFPVELYEYRRDTQIKLSIEGREKSKFAEYNLNGAVYRTTANGRKTMKDKVTKFIDLCKQYMNKELEQELDNEIRFYESTEGEDDTRTLEYLYDLSETVRTFNDYLCIVFLNLSNILTYPNETFYQKYKNNEIRITPDKAVYMANKICKRMQDEFTDIVLENFPIKGTVERIGKAERDMNKGFDAKDVMPEGNNKKKSKGK